MSKRDARVSPISNNPPFVDRDCQRCGRRIGFTADPRWWRQPADMCSRCALAEGLVEEVTDAASL